MSTHTQANKLAYHVGHALRHTYNAKLRVGWLRVCDGLPAGTARDALAQELAGLAYRTDTVSIPSAYRQHTVSIPSGIDWENGNGNGNENRNSVPNGTQPVATAPVTGWTIPTQPFAGAHFAVMPEALVEPCILAGCPACGTVLDPFAGSGTVGAVARRLGREFVGAELNPDYADMARKRIAETQPPLFAT